MSIISRTKELLDVYVAAYNVYHESLAIDQDCNIEVLPLYVEFESDDVSHVVHTLKSIAEASTALRPDFAEQTKRIIENLDIIEREYNRLYELDKLGTEEFAIKIAVQSLENTFTQIPLDNSGRCFNPNSDMSWVDMYGDPFGDLINSLFDCIVHVNGCGDSYESVDHCGMTEILKLAMASTSKK